MVSQKALRGIRQNVRPFSLKKNIRGMVQNRAESFLNPSEAVDIVNMHATEEGSWSADLAGYTKINSGGTAYESGAVVDGMYWYTDPTLADHLFIAINGKLKEINTSSGVASDIDASAGYTAGSQVDFQTLNNVLFTCDGNISTPRRWNGTAAANSSGWPVVNGSESYGKPKFVEEHQGRLAYAYFNNTGSSFFPSHLVLSNLNNGETFTLPATTANHCYVAQVGLGDGQKIVGMRSILVPSSNESQLVIVKDRSIYVLTGQSALLTDNDVFDLVKVNADYGAFNNRCIVQFGQDLLLFNEYGVTSVSILAGSGDIVTSPIESDLVKDVIGRLNYTQKEKCWAVHIKDRREILFFLPTGSSVQCNEAIVYRYPTPGDPNGIPKWSRRTDASSKFKMAHGAIYQKTLYIGSYTGIVGSMFTASKYDSVGIPWRYEFPFYDFGNEKQIKRLLNGDALFKVRSSQSISLRTQWKGGNNNDQFLNSLTVNTTVGGAVYGTAVYGTSYYGSQEEVSVQYKAPGNGKRLKHTLSGTTTDTGPEFLGLTPVIEFGGLSQQWN